MTDSTTERERPLMAKPENKREEIARIIEDFIGLSRTNAFVLEAADAILARQTGEQDQGSSGGLGQPGNGSRDGADVGATAALATWQPIKTAPKDGTEVLIWNMEGHELATWHDREEDGFDQPGHDAGWMGTYALPGRSWGHSMRYEPQGQPTHWMPLPDPPSDLLEDDEDPTPPSQTGEPEPVAWAEDRFSALVSEIMSDTWADICADTDCHPVDINQLGRKRLEYRPRHWTDYIAGRLFSTIFAAPPAPQASADHSSDVRNMVPAEAQARVEVLEEGVRRLGSMEALVSARAIDRHRDRELLARIDYARALLATSAPVSPTRAEILATLAGFDDEYMTSEKHHPGHVLIPVEVFERVRALTAALHPTAPAKGSE